MEMGRRPFRSLLCSSCFLSSMRGEEEEEKGATTVAEPA